MTFDPESRRHMLTEHWAHAWWHLVSALRMVFGGPFCCCMATAWSQRSAVKAGWAWGTIYDGSAAWRCPSCIRYDAESPEL